MGSRALGRRPRRRASRGFDPALPREGKPRIPHPAFNWSTDSCRGSVKKLAALEPATCWPGHFGPLKGDVAGQLRGLH